MDGLWGFYEVADCNEKWVDVENLMGNLKLLKRLYQIVLCETWDSGDPISHGAIIGGGVQK